MNIEDLLKDDISRVRLGEVVEKPTTIKESSYFGSDLVTTENMKSNAGGITPYLRHPTGKAVEYLPGDLLISRIRPYLKKIWLADRVGGSGGDVQIFRPNQRIILSSYLFYILSQQEYVDYMMSTVTGMAIPRADKKRMLEYVIPLPSLTTQQQIVEVLDSFEEIAKLEEEVIRLQEERVRLIRLQKDVFLHKLFL